MFTHWSFRHAIYPSSPSHPHSDSKVDSFNSLMTLQYVHAGITTILLFLVVLYFPRWCHHRYVILSISANNVLSSNDVYLLASLQSHPATLQLKKEHNLGETKYFSHLFTFLALLFNAKCQSIDAGNWDRLALNIIDMGLLFLLDRVLIVSMTIIQIPGKGSPSWSEQGTLGSFSWLMLFPRWHASRLPSWYEVILGW